MVDQPTHSSSRIPVSVPLSLPKAFMNGESAVGNIYVLSNSANEAKKEKHTGDSEAVRKDHNSGPSGAVGIGIPEDVTKANHLENHLPSITMIVEANDSLVATEKHVSEMPTSTNCQIENVQCGYEQGTNGHLHDIRHTDHFQNTLDDNFESSMDRKSSAESGFEEQGNLSNTDSLEKKRNLAKDESSISDLSEFESNGIKDIMTLSCSSVVSSTTSQLSSPSDLLSDMSVSTLLQQEMEPLIDEDSSTSCSFGNSLSESSSGAQTPDLILERSMSDSGMSPVHFEEASRSLPSSKSIEKIVSLHKHGKEQNLVRASKSHENYLHNQDFQFIAIDIDDVTYSLDQIPQNPTPTFKDEFDNTIPTITQQKTEQQNLPADSVDQVDSPILVPDTETQNEKVEKQLNDYSDNLEKGFNSTETKSNKTEGDQENASCHTEKQPTETADVLAKPCDTYNEESNVNSEIVKKCYKDTVICDNAEENRDGRAVSEVLVSGKTEHAEDAKLDKESHLHVPINSETSSEVTDEIADTADEILTKEFGQDGFFYQPPVKHIDQPSAQRLAKRLYNLDGFQKSDVSRHLSKK